MSFVHLHTHSQFSILNGTCKINELLAKAEEYEMPALALTDTCNLYGAITFYKAAKKLNCKAIYGAEIWMWPEGLSQLQGLKQKGLKAPQDLGWHLAFLIENKIGYQNLSTLITTAIFDGMHYRPRIDFDLLKKHSEGLIAHIWTQWTNWVDFFQTRTRTGSQRKHRAAG
jgi:DNA polymerase-3 subunit alpha